jgi:aspartate aminotransferase-like enzyme
MFFSPGPVPSDFNVNINTSHRSEKFQGIFKDTKQFFKEKYLIPKDMDIVFVQGSGTAGIEAVFSSLLRDKSIIIYGIGEFSNRAVQIASLYARKVTQTNNINNLIDESYDYYFYVYLESSESKLAPIEKLNEILKGKRVIVDMVSAFGYYDMPLCDVCITSTSKIIGAIPVMSVVIYKLEVENKFETNNYYLSMKRIIESNKHNYTPHTSLMPQIYSLNAQLKTDKVLSKEEITQNIKTVIEGINSIKELYVLGDECPIITIKSQNTKGLIKYLKHTGFEVYFNPVYMKDYFQIGCYSYKTEIYLALMEEIKNYYEFFKDSS